MTESDWENSTDPQAMLTFLRTKGGVSDRKYRLFACACCRRIWDRLPDDRNRALVVAVEDHPDENSQHPKLSGPISDSNDCISTYQSDMAIWAANYLGQSCYKSFAMVKSAWVSLQILIMDEPELRRKIGRIMGLPSTNAVLTSLPRSLPAAVASEATAQANALRDVIGNPHRPIRVDPSWHTSTVTVPVRQMYESRDFSAAPILADALEEAGCGEGELLEHLRGPGPHVRGCWGLDVVLKKS